MFIGIILGIAILFGVISAFSEVIKKALEVLSLITKFCVSGLVALLISRALSLDFSSQWGELAFIAVGAVIICALVGTLATVFRLVGYSINFFTNSCLLLVIAGIISEWVSINFIQYAITLFLFPRIMWMSDRFATTKEYSHTSYNSFTNTETTYYNINSMDWWGNSGDSWGSIPFQVVLASIFYAVGNITLVSICPIESSLLTVIYVIFATAVNVVFDFFVFRSIDQSGD